MSEPDKDPAIKRVPASVPQARSEFSMEALFFRPNATQDRLTRILPEIIAQVQKHSHEDGAPDTPEHDLDEIVATVVDALRIASTVDPLPPVPQEPDAQA